MWCKLCFMTKSLKKVLKVILSILAAVLVVALAYVLYVVIQYDRIEDNLAIKTENVQERILKAGEEYTIGTYNIGFGAYGQEYSFFMDEGMLKDGTKIVGTYGKSISTEHTLFNTTGAIDTIKDLDPDIMLIQEVDKESHRTRGINQYEMVVDSFKDTYSYSYISDFHSAYLFYPFRDPHGKTEAGVMTLSKYKVTSTIRRSYPVPTGFAKFFDLDRCFAVHRIPVDNGKELIVINSHMSAYDKGGLVRQQQLELLTSVLTEEYNKGNYVIVGGDFNHILGADLLDIYPSQESTPDWIAVLEASDIPEHFMLARATNFQEVPTCRSADMEWVKGFTYTSIVDGFIISDNISFESKNIDTDFMYSDHQPVLMKFKLN